MAPLVPPRLAAVYVVDNDLAAGILGLHETDGGANVLLVQPFDVVVFEQTSRTEDVTYAAFSQVTAGLLTSPGRSPEKGSARATDEGV